MTASLTINGFELELGSDALESFVSKLVGLGVLENETLLLDLAQNGSIGIQREIALNRLMPKEVFDVLVDLDDKIVSYRLIANKEASRFYDKEMLDCIVSAGILEELCSLVRNLKSFSHLDGIQDIVNALFTHEQFWVRWNFIDNPITTDKMYRRLKKDHDPDIRSEVAEYFEQFKE